jgi:hypothetical protein
LTIKKKTNKEKGIGYTAQQYVKKWVQIEKGTNKGIYYPERKLTF